MSWLSDSTELVPGGWLSSACPGLGATGAAIKAANPTGEHGAGVAMNDGLLDASEYLFEVGTQPVGGTVVFDELGHATITVSADGAYVWTYRLREDGVYATPDPTTVSVQVGAPVAITLGALNGTQANASTPGVVAIQAPQLALAAADCVQINTCTVGVVAIDMSNVPVSGRYCSQADLVGRFGVDELVQITNPTDPTAMAIDPIRMANALADVDALIDAKLAARYALPLASVPRVLCNIACDLVRARLYEDRATEHVLNRERQALKLLDEISAGKLTLGLDAQLQPTATTDGPQFTSGGRVFTGATLRDFAG